MPWGYCDCCGGGICVGDHCWVEVGYAIDEAKTFCPACWDKSPPSRAARPDIRNVTFAGHRGPTVLRATYIVITADD